MDKKHLIPLITAVLASLISAFIAVYIARKRTEKEVFLTEQKLRHEYQTEFTVETAVKKLMQKAVLTHIIVQEACSSLNSSFMDNINTVCTQAPSI